MNDPVFLRRKQAGEYLRSKYGFCSEKSLAKIACVRSDGPPFFKIDGGACVYRADDLDAWAASKISTPRRSSRGGAHGA